MKMIKKTALAILGIAMQTYGQKLSDQQEVLSFISDILIDCFSSESVVIRALHSTESKEVSGELQVDAACAFVNDAAQRVRVSAHSAVAHMADGETLEIHLAALRRLLKIVPIDTISIRRRLADQAVEQAGYIF